ncbi:MAG: hypothetical protein CBARDCOR_4014 [uncultured Caballeronia sp.]|nr:MAG: hypothetical protein CBARDCOR_4014 [uncultured Caballeronia sp.]
MAKLVGSVHIVTSIGFNGDVSMTAIAVCPISLVPPTLLVCLNRRSRTHDAAIASGVLSVNVLSDDQRILAELFGVTSGGDMSERFASTAWTRGSTGALLLDDWMDVLSRSIAALIVLIKSERIACSSARSSRLSVMKRKACCCMGAKIRELWFDEVGARAYRIPMLYSW